MEDSFEKEFKQLGMAVRKIREMRGMTQKDLLKATGIARSGLVEIEQGKRAPQGINIFRLCVAFKISPKQLMEVAFKKWQHPVEPLTDFPSKFSQKNCVATEKEGEHSERRRKTTPKEDIFRR